MTAVVLVLLVAIGATVWFGQRSLMYHPDTTAPPPAATLVPGAQDVRLTAADGLTLDAWYVPPADGCTAAVLVAPGNGGNRAGRVELARAIHDRGFGVLLLDYRGYGGNPGRPTEQGLALDARAARSFLLDDAGIRPEDLLYLGESMGTGVVSELAVAHPPAAMVLRSPMTSFGDVVEGLYGLPIGWVIRDTYPVRSYVAGGTSPLAVVYGTGDTLVRPDQSQAVARAARDAGAEVIEVAVQGAGHNDGVLAHGPQLVDALVAVAAAGGVTGCG